MRLRAHHYRQIIQQKQQAGVRKMGERSSPSAGPRGWLGVGQNGGNAHADILLLLPILWLLIIGMWAMFTP